MTCAFLPKTPGNLGAAGFSCPDERVSVKTIHVLDLRLEVAVL